MKDKFIKGFVYVVMVSATLVFDHFFVGKVGLWLPITAGFYFLIIK